MSGEKVSTMDLPESVFGIRPDKSVIHEVVVAYLANQRRGTQSALTRSEVSGGGKKPWKQKHTGRARAGTARSPLWRHGGVIFAPKPRSYYQNIPHAKKTLALTMALTDSVMDKKLTVLDAISVPEPKTKLVAAILKKLNVSEATLVLDSVDPIFKKASRNVAGLDLCRCEDINVYDVMRAKRILMTQKAIEKLVQRLSADGRAA
ncbi:MAG TPA: 50S ribosomal protein L4 [Elusimicrobiota bacterium]|nr:50S ribosomal protein L4 [Elusimicrobiota bacterium]